MDTLAAKQKAIIAVAYAYLTLPICIFFVGWLKPVISVPMTLFFVYGVVLSTRNFDTIKLKTPVITQKQVIIVALMIGIWVLLSGIGGFVWQNRFDHQFRNGVFIILMLAVGAVTPGMEIARTVHNTAVVLIEKQNNGTFEEGSYQYVISQQPLRLDYIHGLVNLPDEELQNVPAFRNFLGNALNDEYFNKYFRK